MLSAEQLKEYQEWAERVESELKNNSAWIDRYKSYAVDMLKNKDKFKTNRRRFRQWSNLHYYLTIGNVEEGKIIFDIRYLGQSVGTLGASLTLKVDKKKNINNHQYFGYPDEIGEFTAPWNEKNGKAKQFRTFFKSDIDRSKLPRQKEHMVESALYSEMEKKSSSNKTLCYIQPLKFANTRIHMKTPLAASKALYGEVGISMTGGEIDLLCRRRCSATVARLVAIEIKDQNKKEESFDKAMKQAIAYSVFLVKLLQSEARNNWLEIFGMQNQYQDKIVIEAAVAMPEGETTPSYGGEIIKIGSDEIVLDYIIIKNYDPEKAINDNVAFEHSFSPIYKPKK